MMQFSLWHAAYTDLDKLAYRETHSSAVSTPAENARQDNIEQGIAGQNYYGGTYSGFDRSLR